MESPNRYAKQYPVQHLGGVGRGTSHQRLRLVVTMNFFFFFLFKGMKYNLERSWIYVLYYAGVVVGLANDRVQVKGILVIVLGLS